MNHLQALYQQARRPVETAVEVRGAALPPNVHPLPNIERRAHGWTSDALRAVSDRFEGAFPDDLLRWGFDTFGDDLVLATGFGPSGVVLMHLVSRVRPGATVFYLDTDLLFPETHDLRRELADRLGITFTRVHGGLSLPQQADREGSDLWRRDPDRCCSIRKVVPLRGFLADRAAWIAGIRRDQSRSRADVGLVEWDRVNQLVKFNPLAGWTEDDVWSYIHVNELPYNRLHDRGYPSVGCIPCTRPVAPGDDPRAGRWQGQPKTECGIHGR